jgi:hypothetical protein
MDTIIRIATIIGRIRTMVTIGRTIGMAGTATTITDIIITTVGK